MNDDGEKEPGAHNRFRKSFSLRAFIQGLTLVAIIYATAAGWLWLSGDETNDNQQQRLVSQTVLINRSDIIGTETELPRPPEALAETILEAEPVPAPAPVLETTPLKSAKISGELYKQTDSGIFPVRTVEGDTVFQAYRRPFKSENISGLKQPIISLGLVGFGLSNSASEAALRSLPPEISLGLSPYTTAPGYWISEARNRGHEVWLTLPVESKDYPQEDTGPSTMLISAPERENQQKLNSLLSYSQFYIGFIASENPSFMQNASDMRPVVGSIYNHGLGFINSADRPGSVARSMALGQNAPYAESDLWIDEELTQSDIQNSLNRLEELARERGYAAGLFRPNPVSYQEILAWLESFEEKGLVLAPLSAQTDIQ